jgi:hypothetical protein
VMDFGIARVAGSEHLTMEGFMMGTPAYMAPEQVRGEEVDRRMDLYSAAVMLYRLVTSRLPFEADSPVTLIHSQLSDPPTPPRQFRPDLPDWMDSILTRGLAKAPADRFQSAADFRLALERGLAGALTQTPRLPFADDNAETIGPMLTPTALRTVPNIATAPQVPPAPSGTARADTSITLRTPHLAVAGVLLALLVVGVGLLAFAALRRPIAPAAVPSTAVEPAATRAAGQASAAATGPESDAASNAQPDGSGPSSSPTGSTATVPLTPAPAPTPASPVTTEQTAGGASAATRPATSGASPPLSTSASAVKPLTPAPGTPQPPGISAAKPPSTSAVPPPTAAGTIAAARPPAPASPPTTASAATTPPSTSPSTDAAGRGAVPASGEAGNVGSRAPNALPESFGDIKTLVADGTKARELDALLILEPERLIIRNRDNGSVLQTAPYQSIAVATYARARQPRWQEDSDVAPIPKTFSGSGFFLKSSRHWLTLQSKSEFVILRLEEKNVKAVLASIKARTGSKVQRPTDRD